MLVVDVGIGGISGAVDVVVYEGGKVVMRVAGGGKVDFRVGGGSGVDSPVTRIPELRLVVEAGFPHAITSATDRGAKPTVQPT